MDIVGNNSNGCGGGDGGSQVAAVPPGFRFHPTEEELLYYYLRKKLLFEAIDLDVIQEVDLNKLEPWDLKEKCRIGTGIQNEWYFFSHKDKKYPTGSRTNRATTAGFWKATGRDKPIHLTNNTSTIIGMRKTLVFYTGRAPHGQKTDWIMHEYRLKNDHCYENMFDPVLSHVQEDAWVVCRVFKKKVQSPRLGFHHHHQEVPYVFTTTIGGSLMHLPLLFSHDHDLRFDDKNVMMSSIPLMSIGGGGSNDSSIGGGDWTCLDKLLVPNDHNKFHYHQLSQVVEMGNLGHKFSHFLT